MGRGGPAEPETITVPPTVEALVELSRSGRHAASDHLETAALVGVETIGCRRCGGGLAGAVYTSNVEEGASIAARLERLPWVAHATVERDFPGSVNIAVTEYKPTAFVRVAADRVALVAATGHVIAFAPAPTPGAIEVKGQTTTPRVGAAVSPPTVARVAVELPARLRAQVTAITVGEEKVTLTLADGAPEIRLGTLGDLRSKGISALAVLDQISGRPCEYVDVAAPQAPVSRCSD